MTYYYVLWNTSEGPKYYRGTKQKAKDGFITVKYNDGSTSYFKEADIGSVENENSGLIKVLTAEDWAANTLGEMSAELLGKSEIGHSCVPKLVLAQEQAFNESKGSKVLEVLKANQLKVLSCE